MQDKGNTKYLIGKKKAFNIINDYPKTKIGKPYLTLKCGRKCFFDIFVKKYGLNGNDCKYSNLDVYRRIKIIECFDFLLKEYGVLEEDDKFILIETIFFRFVIKKHYFRKGGLKLEMLSFYDK